MGCNHGIEEDILETFRTRHPRNQDFLSELGNWLCKRTEVGISTTCFDGIIKIVSVSSIADMAVLSPLVHLVLELEGYRDQRFNGIPRGLDEIDMALKARLTESTRHIRTCYC